MPLGCWSAPRSLWVVEKSTVFHLHGWPPPAPRWCIGRAALHSYSDSSRALRTAPLRKAMCSSSGSTSIGTAAAGIGSPSAREHSRAACMPVTYAFSCDRPRAPCSLGPCLT
eukprot:scaffold1637_cov410-Prasinococcus_capsulatus_cf.AAC.15